MKLLMADASPFARKVRVVALETGQDGDIAFISKVAVPGGADDEMRGANPLGKIPALIRDDGPALYDSRVICRYLDERAKAGLYPANDFDALVLEATADGMMEAALSIVYEKRFRAEELQLDSWMEAQWQKVGGALDVLEQQWMSHLNGNMTIAQIAVGCALGYLDLRHGARNWRDGRPALAAWFEGFNARPSMQATVPAG